MGSVSKTQWWRKLLCVFVCAAHSQPERGNASETLDCSGLPNIPCVQEGGTALCPAGTTAGLGITEPRCPTPGQEESLQCLKAPPAPVIQSNFDCHYHWTLSVKNSAALTDPTHFPKSLPSIIFVFMYCNLFLWGKFFFK